MKKITQFSVNNPVTVLMLVLSVLLVGYISFSKLGIDLFPEMNNPSLYIELQAGDRPPEEIENLYVKNIEAQALRQSGVVNVSSVTKVGTSRVTVEYSWGKDMDEAFLDLQKSISAYSQNSDIEAISITQNDPNSSPIMVVALRNEGMTNLDELRQVAENYIRNELIRLEGIADVTLSGEEVAEVLIETNPYLLDAYGVSTTELSSKIQSYNRNVSGGSIEENGINYSIKGVGMIRSTEDLEKIIVGIKTEEQLDGTTQQVPVYLHDIAKITVTNKDPETIVTLNGVRCIGLSIYKEPHYNTVKAVEQLNNAFESITKALPGYTFTEVKDQGKFINSAIDEVKSSALIGILLAVIILYIFLRRIDTTLIISIAIPISIVATFALMYFGGLSLNVMTLGGLALGAGMLVDNTIIVMENIYRHLQKGENIFQAAIEGTSEVGGAIISGTLTSVVVFLPIVYLQGASGELFKDQAWTVAFALLASLVVAILVLPVLVTKIFKKNRENKPVKHLQFEWYPGLLDKLLKHRWAVILITVLVIGGSVLLMPLIGSEFMPRSSSDNFSVEIKMPEGTRLENTTSALAKIEEMAKEALPTEVKNIYTQVGKVSTVAGSTVVSSENSATMYVSLTEAGARNYSKVIETYSTIIANGADLEFNFLQEEGSLQATMGNNEPPFKVEVKGDDLEVIAQVTTQLKEVVMTQNGLYNVESSIENGAPEIDIKIDRLMAGNLNLSIEQIITQLKNRLDGVNAGEYETNGEMRDITIRQPKVSLSELENIEITSGTAKYRLADVATFSEEQLPREIHRSNQSRMGIVSAYVDKDVAFDHVVKSVNDKIAEIPVPDGYRIQIGGEEIKRKESMSGLTFAMLLSIILVYMVMAAQFESLIHPFIVLLTIPMALVGAVLTFFFVGIPFNIMAYIGMIMLVGIGVNDSIVLIDAINKLRSTGVGKREAIRLAGLHRIRPIIMNSLTAILGVLPLTFGFGESVDLRSPMAWAIAGGLVTSTILTLIVIPCVYDVLTVGNKREVTVV
jgi:HAE1 family hydrophobic/amphiphilic exporter-1